MPRFLVTIEKAPQAGCGGVLVIIFIVWLIAKAGSSSPSADEMNRRQLATDIESMKAAQRLNLNQGMAPPGHAPIGAEPVRRTPTFTPPQQFRAGSNLDPSNDGTDPLRPIAPTEDYDFVDARGGWGWGDRCWNNIKAGKLGWAKAECRKGMSIADPSAQQPRASLLYNLGLIEKKAGNFDDARHIFEQSLALREHPEVRAALDSLP